MKFRNIIFLLLSLPFLAFSQPNVKPLFLENELEAFFKKCEKKGFSGSVLVAQGGKILLEKGYGKQDREKNVPQNAETVFSIGSITKQFTGAAILKLEMQERLTVDDKLIKYFPETPADKAEITLHQLLTHTAGCPDALGDDYELLDAQAFMRRFFEEPLRSVPGAEHHYSNVGYSILGIIVEKIAGRNYEKYCFENLWFPAGMTKTGYLRPGFKPEQLAVGYRNGERWGTALDRPWLPDGPGWHLRANGGVLSTVGDMGRWFEALQTDKVLNKAAREKLFKPHVRECPDCPTFYGYGWVIDQSPDNQRLIWHNGGNGVYNAFMGFIPATGTCCVISSNSNDKIADDYSLRVADILNGRIGGLEEATTEKFTGTYRLPSGSPVRIRFDELDRMKMEWDDTDALLTLSGEGSETKQNTEEFINRSMKMAAETRAGNAGEMAVAMDLPEEEARKMAAEFWQTQQERFGNILEIKELGAVLRPGRGVCLVFLKMVCERKTRYLTYVWRSENLVDFRVSDAMDKDFEAESPDTFFAPNNGLRAKLQPDGSVLLTGKKLVSEVILRRG